MQIILQFIGILVEMPVEISYCLLFWRKDIVRIRDSQFTKGFLVHFIRTDSTAFTAADIVDMIPEALVQCSLHIIRGKIFHCSPGISVGNIFQDIVKAVME